MKLVLAVNGGSSSLKCGLYEPVDGVPQLRYRLQLKDALGAARLEIRHGDGAALEQRAPDFSRIEPGRRLVAALNLVLDWIGSELSHCELLAVGHRVVHGGAELARPMPVDDDLMERLRGFNPLAPLHQPFNLELIQACRRRLPALLQVACFDTMFHVGQSPLERRYALPRHFADEGVQRYGFHGLSYEYVQRRLEQRNEGRGRSLLCHFGAGASMCAVQDGRSIASSMGFTALEGLPMGSRCGNIDPGVLIYLMRQHGLDPDALERLLYKESGWLGVSGVSAEMLELHRSPDPRADEAIEMFAYRAALEAGRLSAALEGCDRILFTGGVGENDADVRARMLRRLGWLGVRLDEDANARGDELISLPDSPVRAFVIHTHEGAMIAQHVLEQLL
ncbi:acetate kinase [Marinobacterium nitratireducens]|uniref:Acetate kinase n=1 Tax=Marinobacterium nitratireducens TaxID=518897 RepID=A0A917ZG50_9GAMM|nr:acetate/propionate family kinase [Marinobacterium nitratireducens]GGO82390.1 acetate kinase [Marinobacterium nitratireducens]